MGNVAEWVAIVVSVLVGVAGLVYAGIAHSGAKKANELAQRAAVAAEDAVAKAGEANQIAENANALSEEANALTRAQTLKQADPSHVEWVAKWDGEQSVVVVSNEGRDVACDPTVLVKTGNLDKLVRGDDRVARRGEILVPFPEVPEHRRAHNVREEEARRGFARERWGYVGSSFGWNITLDVRWVSEAGNPCQQTVKCFIS